ncbi:DNA helicase [Tanacetum coccineum]
MRLSRPGISEHQKQHVQRFSSWLLDIGDGNIGVPDEIDHENCLTVHIPDELCIPDNDNAIHQLINFIYDDETFEKPVVEDLQKKVIVFPNNKTTNTINEHVLSLVNHERCVYLSSDAVTSHGNDGDKEGNAIQANMDLKDTEYFKELLQLNNAYRISWFGCTDTKKWQQTLDNKTTLNFGRYTSIEPIANDPFLEHYFNFIAYNEVQSKADVSGATLTEFINPTTVLDIQRQPCRTDEEEKNKKQRVKFTREATIMEINASKGWYYRKCTACNKKVPGGSFEPHCPDHGPQPMANYGAIINGGTSVATITCFSSKAHTFLLDCNDVVNVADNKDNRDVPVGL